MGIPLVVGPGWRGEVAIEVVVVVESCVCAGGEVLRSGSPAAIGCLLHAACGSARATVNAELKAPGVVATSAFSAVNGSRDILSAMEMLSRCGLSGVALRRQESLGFPQPPSRLLALSCVLTNSFSYSAPPAKRRLQSQLRRVSAGASNFHIKSSKLQSTSFCKQLTRKR